MKNKGLYEFGDYTVNCHERTLYKKERIISLAPKVFDTLLALVERNQEIVLKEELMETVWPGAFVEESNLTQNIYRLRQIFGKKNQYIKTLPKRGYRFDAEVRFVEQAIETEIEEFESHQQENDATEAIANESVVPGSTPDSIQDAQTANRFQITSFLRPTIFALVLLSLIGSGVYAFYSWRVGNKTLEIPLEQVTFSEVSNTGDIARASLSPDGQLISFIRRHPGKNGTLWLRDVTSGDELPLKFDENLDPRFLNFSPAGNWIYFSSKGTSPSGFDLYRTSRLGGKVELVVEDVTGAFSLSWDAQRVAFYRLKSEKGAEQLVVRNFQSNSEKAMLEKSESERFVVQIPPAWSADSQSIFAVSGSRGSVESRISKIDLDSSTESAIAIRGLVQIGAIVALDDGNTLVLTAREKRAHHQLYKYEISSNSLHRLSNDVSVYHSLSRAKNGNSIVITQNSTYSNLWYFPKNDFSKGQQLTFGKRSKDGLHGVSAAGSDRFVYISLEGKSRDLWAFDIETKNRTRLTNTVGENRRFPFATKESGDVFVSFFKNRGFSIQRMASNGGSLRELTSKKAANDRWVNVSPDEKTLYFIRRSKGKSAIIQMSLDTKKEQELSLPQGFVPKDHLAISPDGNYLAFRMRGNDTSSDDVQTNIGIIGLGENSGFLKQLEVDSSEIRFRWYTDSNSIIFARQSPKKAVLWRQSIDGPPAPEKFLEIPNRVFDFDINNSGDVIAAVGERVRDMVMMKDYE